MVRMEALCIHTVATLGHSVLLVLEGFSAGRKCPTEELMLRFIFHGDVLLP